MALLDNIKLEIRIPSNDYDSELTGHIAACKADLKLSGISDLAINDDDPLIAQAISTYCKAHFGIENPDSEKYGRSYDSMKSKLLILGDYVGV